MSDEKEPPTQCSVISTKLDEQGTVFYIIRVSKGANSFLLQKRYSNFETLQANIIGAGRTLPSNTELPTKRIKLFTDHTSAAFIEERRVLLENFLRKLINHDIGRSPPFVSFLAENRMDDPLSVQTEEEKKKNRGALPADVEITGATVPSTRTMTDHVLYQIDLENNNKRQSFSKWTVLKRFNHIYEMDAAIRADFFDQPRILDAMPVLPQRKAKLFTSHLDDAFIESRRVLLENYLNRMIGIVEVVQNKNFLVFLGVQTE
jgi:hypothetical protein